VESQQVVPVETPHLAASTGSTWPNPVKDGADMAA
jgi:hypothetical protein